MNQDVAALLCKKAAKVINNSVTISHRVAYHVFDGEIKDQALAYYEVYCRVGTDWQIREFDTWNKVHTFMKQIILTKGANLVQESNADAL